MSLAADQQTRAFHHVPGRAQTGQLFHQGGRVNDDAADDHTNGSLVERARGDEMQYGLMAFDHQRVSRVVAALKTDHDVGIGRQQIDDLALALVAPLEADDDQTVNRVA